MTEKEFTAAAEQHLDMVYRIALNCLRKSGGRGGRSPDGHAAAVAVRAGVSR